jgi:lipopolysaccharide biosynthesis regulator YciM
MSQDEFSAKVGSAWAVHRQGDQNKAISEFSTLVRQQPSSYDALYGLGLAQRSAGRKDDAIKSFQECQTLVNKALADHPGEDKFEILQRMVSQRLAELGVGSGK